MSMLTCIHDIFEHKNMFKQNVQNINDRI